MLVVVEVEYKLLLQDSEVVEVGKEVVAKVKKVDQDLLEMEMIILVVEAEEMLLAQDQEFVVVVVKVEAELLSLEVL